MKLVLLAALSILVLPLAHAASNPDPVANAVAAGQAILSDPGSAAQDPAATVGDVLNPSDPEQAPPSNPGNGQGDNGGWSAPFREAFQHEFATVGIAALAAAALGIAGFTLVTRYVSPKEALKNPQRAMLFGFIKGNPGVHLKRLSDEFEMKTSSILWHIRKLECAELVHSERANGFRVFYPVEGGVEVKKVSRATTALQNDNALQVFQAIQAEPAVTAATVGARLAMHIGTVRWHLKKLAEFGLVEEIVRGDVAVYLATPLGTRALLAVQALPTPAAPAGPTPTPVTTYA